MSKHSYNLLKSRRIGVEVPNLLVTETYISSSSMTKSVTVYCWEKGYKNIDSRNSDGLLLVAPASPRPISIIKSYNTADEAAVPKHHRMLLEANDPVVLQASPHGTLVNSDSSHHGRIEKRK